MRCVVGYAECCVLCDLLWVVRRLVDCAVSCVSEFMAQVLGCEVNCVLCSVLCVLICVMDCAVLKSVWQFVLCVA